MLTNITRITKKMYNDTFSSLLTIETGVHIFLLTNITRKKKKKMYNDTFKDY